MKPKHFEHWSKLRAQGKARYILRTGVLAWGLPMFLFMVLIINRRTTSLTAIGLNLLIFSLGGAVFGWITWALSERQYQRALKSQDSSGKTAKG